MASQLVDDINKMKARHVLQKMGYDPLVALVNVDRQLEAEVLYQYKKRTGEVVELSRDGKPKAMREEILLGNQQARIGIANTIMKYAYGTMPTVVLENDATGIQPLEIKMTVDNADFKQIEES